MGVRKEQRILLERARKNLRFAYHALCECSTMIAFDEDGIYIDWRRHSDKEKDERRHVAMAIGEVDLSLQHVNMRLGHNRYS